MPITYSVDTAGGLIRTFVTGELTMSETLRYFDTLGQDPSCPEGAVEIVDFTGVTDFSLRFSQMASITKDYQATKVERRILATVFHCPTPLSYGIARMLHSLHGLSNPEHIVKLTRSRDELERVVAGLRPPPG